MWIDSGKRPRTPAQRLNIEQPSKAKKQKRKGAKGKQPKGKQPKGNQGNQGKGKKPLATLEDTDSEYDEETHELGSVTRSGAAGQGAAAADAAEAAALRATLEKERAAVLEDFRRRERQREHDQRANANKEYFTKILTESAKSGKGDIDPKFADSLVLNLLKFDELPTMTP